jgi:hypothetical protein
MNTLLDETAIRTMVNGLKTNDPQITNENVQKRIRGNLESQGFQWNEALERKIQYCVRINPVQ